jgi:hypothetical protein
LEAQPILFLSALKKMARKVIKRPVTAIMLSCFIVSAAFSASPPKDKDWLADLDGLPSREEIEKLSLHVDEIMRQEKNKKCTSINPRLRKMIFLHFASYQHMVNKRAIYLDEEKVHRWAHVFAMLLKESSGDTTNVTAMSGRSYATYEAKSDLKRWRKIAKLSKEGKIPLNYQTNFGLTQLSVDRLFVALKLAGDPAYLKDKKKDGLNTAIAVRKLIWFYQDFAQGRLTQDHDRIHHHEQGNPEYSARFSFGASTALLLCGTNYMFYEGYHGKAGGAADLTDAMASIAYCKIGNSKEGYGISEKSEKCFAEWVTLCPTLNFDIAMLTPLKYFATRDAAPVCEGTFKALLKKKPVAHKKAPSKKISHEPKQITHHEDTRFGHRVKKLLDSASSLLTNFFTGSTSKSNNH